MLMISDVASPTFSASHALQEEIRQSHTHTLCGYNWKGRKTLAHGKAGKI